MSKYTPLAKHLGTLRTDEARFTFPEIEQIIGADLPQSARSYHAWCQIHGRTIRTPGLMNG